MPEFYIMGQRLLSIREVAERTTLSKNEIYRRIRENKFPHQIRLGIRRVAWREKDIDFWIAAL